VPVPAGQAALAVRDAAAPSEMQVARPEFVPDPSLSREAMEQLQHDIAGAAVFADDIPFDPAAIAVPEGGIDAEVDTADRAQAHLDATLSGPVVAGVDQAFRDEEAVSAVVAIQDGTVKECVHAVEPVEIPYVPGLLSFREGGAILAALSALECDPDVVLVDGSGRIHFREAGLATHVGVTVDVPTVGVAKNLLCGRPRESLADPLPAGTRVAIEADADVTALDGTVIGHAVQTRQYDSPNRHVNPLYVSPGHRISAGTAADVVERCCGGYKLPEPTRLADSHADASR
jgi:deoxyribonuclease V